RRTRSRRTTASAPARPRPPKSRRSPRRRPLRRRPRRRTLRPKLRPRRVAAARPPPRPPRRTRLRLENLRSSDPGFSGIRFLVGADFLEQRLHFLGREIVRERREEGPAVGGRARRIVRALERQRPPGERPRQAAVDCRREVRRSRLVVPLGDEEDAAQEA